MDFQNPDLQPYVREAYEEYIMAENAQQRNTAMDKLIEGSENHKFLVMLDKLTHQDKPLTAEDMKKINGDQYTQEYQLRQGAKILKKQNAFKNYDFVATGQDRDAALKQITDVCGIQNQVDRLSKFKKPYYQEHAGIQDGDGKEESKINLTECSIPENFFKRDKVAELKAEALKHTGKNNRYQHSDILRALEEHPHLVHELDFGDFNHDAVYEVIEQLANKNELAGIENKSMTKKLKDKISAAKKDNEHWQIPHLICQAMSLEQIEKLKAGSNSGTDAGVIGACFQKQHEELLSEENQAAMTNEQKLANLKKLYDSAKSQGLPKSLQFSLIEQILKMGPKVNVYDKDLFKQFVSWQEERYGKSGIMSSLKSAMFDSHQNANWSPYLSNVNVSEQSSEHGSMKQLYLEHFAFEKAGDLKEFKKKDQGYLHEDEINEIEKRVCVYLAQNGLAGIKNKEVTPEYYKMISDQVSLKFLPENKEKFTVAEPVELRMEIKNVDAVYCKVFEFNTLTFYRKNLRPFDTAIDLDGLESTMKKDFNNKYPANFKKTETFLFEELAGKTGLFIIEFLGNGCSARAVVKKGSLSLIHRSTVAGHMCYILDDDRNVCKGNPEAAGEGSSNSVGMWFQNKFYEAKPDGLIFLPYATHQQTAQAILQNGDFAQLTEFTRKQETYELECKFFMVEESVLIGQKTQVVVSPRIWINGRKASLDQLKNARVNLRTQEYIDGTPLTQQFTGLKFTDDKETTISFQVTSNIEYIDIEFVAQVQNTTTKQLQDFQKQQRFPLVTQMTAPGRTCELYLRMVKDNKYEVQCLGRNGEPRPFMRFSMKFSHRMLGSFDHESITTDEQGKLYLGNLDHIENVTCRCRDQSDLFKSWNIPNLNSDVWTYPKNVELVQGAKFEIPVANMWDATNKLDRRQISLIQSSLSGHCLADWFKKIKVIQKGNNQYYTLSIENLQQGDYTLRLHGDLDVTIQIKVHNGQFWNGQENCILKNNCIREIVSSNKIVKISEFGAQEGGAKLVMKLADYSKNARVHVFAQHFVAPKSQTLCEDLQDIQQNKLSCADFYKAKWENMFMSNRTLGDEYRYVFDRATAERQLGNLLDRPSLLMKRLFTRQTETENENLGAGSNFARHEEKQAYMRQEIGHSQQRMMKKSMVSGRHAVDVSAKKNYITEQQNFLKNSPLQVFNLKPNEQGIVTLENKQLLNFATVTVLVVDEDSVVQHVHSMQEPSANPIQKRNLTLNKALDENKGLTQTRESKPLYKGQADNIPDFLSSQIQLVDELKKVSECLKLIRRMHHGHDDAKWSELDIVLEWHTFTNDQKNRYLSEYGSHEFHLFIKMKDQKYFDEVVRGVLANKMEKQLFDFYLLDNYAEVIKSYGKPHLVQQLCAFERCLLIESLARHSVDTKDQSFMKHAKALVRIMEDKTEVDEQSGAKSTEMANRIFDLVLNMNAMENNSGSLPSPRGGGARHRSLGVDCDEDMFGQTNSYNAPPPMAPGSNRMAAQRNQNLQLEGFQQLDETSEYRETQYFKSASGNQLIEDNEFWRDYANHLLDKATGQADKQFLSANFTQCFNNKDSFLAFCVLDMPFRSELTASFNQSQNNSVDVLVSSNSILFKKEIKEVEIAIKNDFMVTHRYHRMDNQDRNQVVEAIPKEFIVNTPYECEVIMTNVSPMKQKFSLLVQIPFGALPIKQTKYMKSEPCELNQYSTKINKFHFYFPSVGKMGHYPSNVSIDGKVTARGTYNELNVVRHRKIEKENIQNFDDLIQVGTQEQILNYIRTENLLDRDSAFQFQKIYFLCLDEGFWNKCIEILRMRQIYDETIWLFAFKYSKNEQLIKEWFCRNWSKQNGRALGPHFESALVTVKPTDFGFSKFLEYNPMINSRAHSVGKDGQKKILNKTFRQTYDRFLVDQLYKKQPSSSDKLIFVYYLQLQDRINEAIKLFNTIPRPGSQVVEGEPALAFGSGEINNEANNCSTLELQYDYMSAYFDFFTGVEGKYLTARRVVQRYDNYPVSHWRLRFLAIADQLNEIDGEFDDPAADELDENSSQGASSSDASLRLAERKQENLKRTKKQEPNISLTDISEEGTLRIESVNIPTIAVKYYIIDAEILFSRAPFLKGNAEEFSYVKPCDQLEAVMVAEEQREDDSVMSTYITKEVPIPNALKNKNLVIEINGGGQQFFKTHYSSLLNVQIFESYGELKVTDKGEGGKALAQVYVKVFSKDKSGKEVFFRDGYTDIRGKFEYAMTSGDKLKGVKMFAILVQSSDKGSQIREVKPPVDEHVDNNQMQQQQQQEQYGYTPSQGPGSLQVNKMNRMVQRNAYVSAKQKKM